MKLIERYILKRASAHVRRHACAADRRSSGSTQALGQRQSRHRQRPVGAAPSCAWRRCVLPSVIPLILPFALGHRRGADADGDELPILELTVLNAAGSSRMTIIRPIIDPRPLRSASSPFAVDNFVEPYSRTGRAQDDRHAPMPTCCPPVVQENTFRKIARRPLCARWRQRRSGGVLHPASSSPIRATRAYELVYYAREGAVDDSGSALRHEGRRGASQTAGRQRLDHQVRSATPSTLTDLTQMAGQATISAKDRDLHLSLIDPDPNDPAIREELRSLHGRRSHRRFTEWLISAAVFGLIALRLQRRCALAPRGPCASDDHRASDLPASCAGRPSTRPNSAGRFALLSFPIMYLDPGRHRGYAGDTPARWRNRRLRHSA